MKPKFEESLPEYEQYKNMSCVVLGPKESSKKSPKKASKKPEKDYYNKPEKVANSLVLNNTLFEPNIIKNLRALYSQYSEEFSDICNTVLKQKYKLINKNIYKFCNTGFENNNGMMGSIILNTDQNRPDFFQQLLEYIKRKAKSKKDPFDLDSNFNYVYPQTLNDLEKLFKTLNIHDDEIIESKKDQLKRIIIVTDIQSSNHVAFNIFIQRILEYNRREFPRYDYILIFDVAYDPKTLFDKINVSLLSKIVFFSITNTPSNYLYHEILYNFIYKMNTGFYIPKSYSLKDVLDSIELHQISIESFKHYFNLILFQFFFMHQWNDDEYLIFLNELDENKIKQSLNLEKNENIEKKNESVEKKNKSKKKSEETLENIIDNKRREILENKLNEIYNETPILKELTKEYNILSNNINNEVEKLLKSYKDKMNTWKIFKKFYELFEGFITNYLKDSKDHKDSVYYFLYKFLQYDSSSNFQEIIKRRAKSVYKIINKLEDMFEAFKKYFYPNYLKISKEIEPLLNDADKKFLNNISDKLVKFMKGLEDIDLENVGKISDNFNIWVEELFNMECFKKINESDNEQVNANCKRKFVNVYHRYLDYKYIIEPPLMHSFLTDLFNYATTIKGKKEKDNNVFFEIKEGDFEFKNALRAYFKCFMNLSSTFKLSHFFYDFLIEFNINAINDKNKELVEKYKKIFLVLSYWFNLVGIFQKKKGKKQIFVKNYYEKVNYFGNNKDNKYFIQK